MMMKDEGTSLDEGVKDEEIPEEEIVVLLQEEGAAEIMAEPGITSITFVKVNTDNRNVESATIFIRERLRQIITSNPWLAGHIAKDQESGKVCLVYPKSYSEEYMERKILDKILSPPTFGLNVSSTTPYEDLCRSLKRSSTIVKSGNEHLRIQSKRRQHKKNKICYPIILVTIVPDSQVPDEALAVIFSISHCVADVHGHYEILGMLSKAGKVKALNIERKHNLAEAKLASIGKQENSFLLNRGFWGILGGILCGRKPQCCANIYDSEKMKAAQDAAEKERGVDWVSPIDVISSEFAKLTKARVLGLHINLRNRLHEYQPMANNKDVGNYHAMLIYDREVFLKPKNIRKSLTIKPFFKTHERFLPGCCQLTFVSKIAVVNDWACFQKLEMRLFDDSTEDEEDENQQLLHIPWKDMSLVPFDYCIIFKPMPKSTAALLFAKSVKRGDFVSKCNLGKNVSDSMFPWA